MALSAGANITGLNHTLQQLITQLTLYKLKIPGKVPANRDSMFTLITGTEQHEHANYWYRAIICTGVVALASPAPRTINYHLVCFTSRPIDLIMLNGFISVS